MNRDVALQSDCQSLPKAGLTAYSVLSEVPMGSISPTTEKVSVAF